MLIKHLPSIVQIPTSHLCGMKQVLLSNDENTSSITQIAITVLRNGETAKSHFHTDMQELFLVLSGKIRMTVNGVQNECAEGDFIIVDCREVHELHALTDCRLLTVGCAV